MMIKCVEKLTKNLCSGMLHLPLLWLSWCLNLKRLKKNKISKYMYEYEAINVME